MWLTSKRPAALRTAACSSRMLEYCWGSSQPPKLTILPPSAWWRSNSGVRRGCPSGVVGLAVLLLLGKSCLTVQGVGCEVLKQLFVVQPTRLVHDLADLACALCCPLQFLGELVFSGSASPLPGQRNLGLLVLLGRFHDPLC